MSRIRRNSDLHTSQADSERLVLQVLAAPTVSGHKVTLPLSALGYAAYPGYSFKAPQGAALAAARLARGMADRGLGLRVERKIRRKTPRQPKKDPVLRPFRADRDVVRALRDARKILREQDQPGGAVLQDRNRNPLGHHAAERMNRAMPGGRRPAR